jgi:DNA polymerase-4
VLDKRLRLLGVRVSALESADEAGVSVAPVQVELPFDAIED